MSTYIASISVVQNESCFFTDDQEAIRAGAVRDGFAYTGSPVTAGFERIRQPGRAVSLVLHCDDGARFVGDCVEVQYVGVGGRSAPMVAASLDAHLEGLRNALVGRTLDGFRVLMAAVEELRLPRWMEYGVSQAVLRATAHAQHRSMAELIVDEWELEAPTNVVPVFAQSGDGGREAYEKMILKSVDALPHGLINNPRKVGYSGEALLAEVSWIAQRIGQLTLDPTYRPTLHFDTYGTLGLVFGRTRAVAEYIVRLQEAAAPYPLRIEHPVDAGSRDGQLETLAALRADLRTLGCDAAVVADEWCNTLEDIELFSSAGAADMIHVKTPDLGGLHKAVDALLTVRNGSAKAYAGGTCNETVLSSQACAHVALATRADLTLAKPGMGVDEGLSMTRNEMRTALATWQERV